MPTPGPRLLLLVVAMLIADGGGAAAQDHGNARDLLQTWFGLTSDDLRALDRGRAVVRSLPTRDRREIATVGVVRMAVTPDFYAASLRDVAALKRSEWVLDVGTFGAQAAATDLRGLRLGPDVVRELAACRLHDCGMQLSREAIEAIVAARTAAPGSADAVSAAVRRAIADAVRAYQRVGDVALMTYADDRTPVSVAAEFARMVSEPPAVLRRLPLLSEHLARYPHSAGDGVEDVLYWSRERVGPAVVVSATHLAIARPHRGPIAVAAASKQVYGSKYFDASLGITMVLPHPGGGAPMCDVVYVNRSRIDAFGGFFGRLKRAVARPRVRGGVERGLLAARERIERAFARETR